MNIPEHIVQTIRRKYSRPAKLSDPCSDFSQEELKAIISKCDADLTETDLICISQSLLPAGNYNESVYFLPIALERFCKDDGFAEMTSSFELAGDCPKNCGRACAVFEALNAISTVAALGDLLLQRHLGGAETYEQAAWLVFFLEQHLYGLYRQSAYLQEVFNDKPLLRKAYDTILSHALNDEDLLRFWNRRLDSCGIW